jgi:exopolysaccharide production protein ExoY
MTGLGEPRKEFNYEKGYAPFQPRVMFTFSDAMIPADYEPVIVGGRPVRLARRDASDARPIREAAPDVSDRKASASDTQDVPLAEYQWRSRSRLDGWKRALDVSVSLLLLVFLAPLLGLVAIWIGARRTGPVWVRDARIGRFGSVIQLLRFRSDDDLGGLGKLLRQSGIDALPKLVNVLRGDLSLVGPQPITQTGLAEYGLDVIYYLKVQPGLTGLWRADNDPPTDDASRNRREREYARTRTVWSDLKVISDTVSAKSVLRSSV